MAKLINCFRIFRLGSVLALPAWAAGPGGREQQGWGSKGWETGR